MIDKAPDAYRTISEVADELDLPQHVLRFWETRFGQIKPLKRGGGRRYYRPDDVELLSGIRHLLYSEGYTIKGVQRILKEQGPRAVQAFARPMVGEVEFEPPQPTPVPSVRQQVAAPATRVLPPAVEPAFDDSLDDAEEEDLDAYEPPSFVAPPRPVAEPAVARPVAPPPAPAIPVTPPRPPVAPPPPSPPVAQQPAPPQPYLAPLAPAFPPERPYTLPAGTEQRSGAPVYMPEPDMALSEPPPRPVTPPPPANPTVSYMRGGLTRPAAPAAQSPAPPPPAEEEPAPALGFSVRRAIRPANPVPPAQEQEPQRYSPLVEPDLGEALERAAPPPIRPGLSDEARRSLQSALFELSECRRAIEITIAARDR